MMVAIHLSHPAGGSITLAIGWLHDGGETANLAPSGWRLAAVIVSLPHTFFTHRNGEWSKGFAGAASGWLAALSLFLSWCAHVNRGTVLIFGASRSQLSVLRCLLQSQGYEDAANYRKGHRSNAR